MQINARVEHLPSVLIKSPRLCCACIADSQTATSSPPRIRQPARCFCEHCFVVLLESLPLHSPCCSGHHRLETARHRGNGHFRARQSASLRPSRGSRRLRKNLQQAVLCRSFCIPPCPLTCQTQVVALCGVSAPGLLCLRVDSSIHDNAIKPYCNGTTLTLIRMSLLVQTPQQPNRCLRGRCELKCDDWVRWTPRHDLCSHGSSTEVSIRLETLYMGLYSVADSLCRWALTYQSDIISNIELFTAD